MKKALKLFGLMLLAGATTFVACSEKENNEGNDSANLYTIQVSSQDAAMGTVLITPDSTKYHAGTQVTISATPATGYRFVKWTGTSEVTENPYTFTVSGNANYTAVFEALPEATWSASFDGVELDVAGYGDYQTNGEGIWLIQMAMQAEGTSVYFPYIVMWMQGNNTDNFAVSTSYGAIELYKDTYYTDSNDGQYGDWQYYATNSLHCTALDMTALMVSFTGVFSMYNLGDIVSGTAQDPADCTMKDLTVTVNNATFVLPEGKRGMHKMMVK